MSLTPKWMPADHERESQGRGHPPTVKVDKNAITARVQLVGIRAITFDVGGTLITPWPSVGHVYAAVAARHGYDDIPPSVVNEQFAAAWRALEDFRHTRAEWAKLVDAAFHGLVEPPPSETFFSTLYDRFTEPDAWHVFDDVHPALHRLKQRGFSLAVVSNWDERLRPLLRALDLDTYFDAIIVSAEVGATKPSRIIFDAAAAALDLAPSSILHLGDSLEADVGGAEGAGMKALLLARGNSSSSQHTIRSLAEV